MPAQISRLYNFVDDKNNGIPITSSRVDAEFNQLILTANNTVIVAATAPSSPVNGQLWFDSTNKLLKQYRNAEWVVMGVVHVSATVMATIQTGDIWIDTSGSEVVVNIRNKANGAWIAAASLGVNVFTGTQKWVKGADVASATTITLGEDGNLFNITGTTTITSVTIKEAGTIVSLSFAGILTFTNGSNLKLNGDYTTAANRTITLVSDGTNWLELSRSYNATQVGFGAWTIPSLDTAILAATDGIIVGSGQQSAGGTGQLNILTDSANPPTTVRTQIIILNTVGSSYSYSCPVKKGDYYKISQVSHWTNNQVFFIPLGS